MFCAILAIGLLNDWQGIAWQRIVLLWLLVDLAWGGIWRLASGRSQLLSWSHMALPQASQTFRLPYMQANSPAALLLSWDYAAVWPWLWRMGLPIAVVALLIAASLGEMALALTLVVIVLTFVGWAVRRSFGVAPPLFHCLITVALPWGLTLWQLGVVSGDPRLTSFLLWGAAWSLYSWGVERNHYYQHDLWAQLLIIAATLLLLGLLITLRAPLWLGLFAITSLPTLFWVLGRQPLGRVQIWGLLSMLISAAAMSG
jgi:hypothetical protein